MKFTGKRKSNPSASRRLLLALFFAADFAVVAVLLLIFWPAPSLRLAEVDRDAVTVARGEYLFNAGGCGSCHTADEAKPLAGGVALESPFGTFYAPNITPDPDTGIGGWSEADFVRAFRHGVSPEGRFYYPAFPYTAYTGISDTDLLAIKAYLDSQEPIPEPNRAHELVWFAGFRPGLRLWNALYLEPGPAPAEMPRGAYLVEHLGHCAECHSPRDWFGGIIPERRFAGAAEGPGGEFMPNITPHADGLGDWSAGDLAFLLELGMTPEGDFVGGKMAAVVEDNTGRLAAEDRAAMADYLLGLPARPGP